MKMRFAVPVFALALITLRSNVLEANAAAPAAAAKKPNVLFIAVDDLNDWIGCLAGHPQALTPNLDRLAKRGVVFANAHCAAPACNPSRAAVFSGRMPQITGVWSNDKGQKIEKQFPKDRLLTATLRKAGYKILGTGKLLHGGGQSLFDEYYSVGQRWSPFPSSDVKYKKSELASKGTDNPQHRLQDSQGRTVILPLNRMPSDRRPNKTDGESFDWGPFDVPDSDFGDTQITNWAIEKLQSGVRVNRTEKKAKTKKSKAGAEAGTNGSTKTNSLRTSSAGKKRDDKSQPFFLAVGYYRPHIPLWAPQRFFQRFKNEPGQLPPFKTDDLDDLSKTAKNWAIEPVTAGSHATVVKYRQWQKAVEAYLACVTYVDFEIGRLLDALDESKFADNTLIVMWSDHGWHLGEKQHWGKWTGWERSTKVPVIVVPPKSLAKSTPSKNFAAGVRCEDPVSLIDLYPTIAEFCSASPPTLNGQSLVALLENPTRDTNRAVLTMFDRDNSSVRTKSHRYIRYADGSEELYAIARDPHEWNNLANDAAAKKTLEQMRRRLAELTATLRD